MRNLGTQNGTHFVKIWAKNVGFLPKFSPNGGHFGYLDFSKYVFSNGFYWDVCRKGFLRNNYLFHGIKTEK